MIVVALISGIFILTRYLVAVLVFLVEAIFASCILSLISKNKIRVFQGVRQSVMSIYVKYSHYR